MFDCYGGHFSKTGHTNYTIPSWNGYPCCICMGRGQQIFENCPHMFRATYKIIINTAARTLTLYKDGKWFKSYPVGVGKPSTPTPKGTFKIINKAPHPGGVYEPRWMGISSPGIGIHGPVNPASIGKAQSDGCIRMRSKDVIELYSLVPVGTVVEIK